MFRYTAETNMPSNDRTQINRNVVDSNPINQDDNAENDNGIEVIKINSSNNEQSDSDEHECALNAAWYFIDEARQNFPHNSGHHRNFDNKLRCQIRKQNGEHEKYNTKHNTINSSNEIFYNISENWIQERNYCYATINDYLDNLENSFEDVAPSKREQNYFNNDATVYDLPSSVYAEEGPVIIYSYSNRNCVLYETNENLINSPNRDSPTTSDSSTSLDFHEETKKRERNFYRITNSVHPIKVPRLPLNIMLPTVTEIHEPNVQTPDVTDVSSDENITLKRKPNNSWIMTDKETTDSKANTTDTSGENSVTDSMHNSSKTRAQLNDTNRTVLVHRQNESNGYNVDVDKCKHSNSSLKEPKAFNSVQICRRSKSTVFFNDNTLENKEEQRSGDLDAITDDPESKIIYANDCFDSKERNSTSNEREVFSVNSSIPTLHLSLSTEADSMEHSCFKRLIKCVLCCKVAQ